MHSQSVLLIFWHWFDGKAEEKIAKKEENEKKLQKREKNIF